MKECDNIVALAKELGVSRRRLYKWKEQQGSGGEEIPAAVQTYIGKLEQENNQLKRMMAEKALEVDFFKGALQKVEAVGRNKSDSGEKASTTRSGK
jgi:transposase-like protein